MTSEKTATHPDLAALAAEACDLWQDHLAAYANDPQAKDELIRMMEPQRQLLAGMFADYASLMQKGAHEASTFTSAKNTAAAAGAKTAAAPSDDSALRLAQLAHRVAELEKRLEKMEQSDNAPAPKSAGKSAGPRKKS